MNKELIRKNKDELIKAHNLFQSKVETLEVTLSEYIDFDFFIQYQPSDGFVVVHSDSSKNAPLGSCISVIFEKGRLSFEEYLKHTI